MANPVVNGSHRPSTCSGAGILAGLGSHLINCIPAGAYTCDAEGLITSFNRRAVELWGREPALNDPADRFCGSFRLFATDGTPIAHDRCWMALALRDGTEYVEREIVVERPDGSRRTALAHASPLRDPHGRLLGAVNILVDITDRKRTEEALRAGEEQYRAIVENTPECVKLVAADGTLLQMNRAGLAMIESDESAVGKCVYDVIAPEDRAAFRALNERVCRGERGTLSFDVVGRNGTRRHMETTAVPLPAPGGGFHQLAISRDVTARRREEMFLRGQTHVLELIARGAPLADVLAALCRLVEAQSNGPVLGSVLLCEGGRLRHGAGPSLPDAYNRAIDGAEVGPAVGSCGTAAFRKEPVYVSDIASDPLWANHRHLALPHGLRACWSQPILAGDGTVLGTFAMYYRAPRSPGPEDLRLVDLVTRTAGIAIERDRALELRSRLAAIVESSDDAIVSKTLDGVIQSWNAGAERVFGYTAAEAVGRPITLIIPPERYEEERMILSRLRRGERIDHYETVRVAKDGRRLDISLTVSPVRDASGRITGASKVARDVTDRRRAEAALKEADRRKDEFLALLAHELRNPLAPLRSGLQILRLAEHDPAARARAREMMDRQLGHMVRLVDDLLDVSRITRGKMELRRARVRLADVIGSAVETARPLIDAAGHSLEVSLPEAAAVLDADLTRLAQVFANLLTNSAKYTPPGGRIRLTAAVRDGEAVVTVRDTGIGIPAEALPRIFDMFSQVDRSIERASGGLGIGLALVKGLVEMHGGTVAADSPGPGRGSTFTVRLPTAGPLPAGPPQPAENAARDARRRVLVVDDNRDGAESLAEMLRLLGNEVFTAHDGLEAVEAAGQLRPDLVLMDVGMPRLNGLDATRRIREQPWGRAMTVIALTGWGQEADRALSREAGCDGHLVKPVGLAELQQLLAGASTRPAARGGAD
jgi:PAS domain S-box-containing protein